jgi:Uma2 family endonuclease
LDSPVKHKLDYADLHSAPDDGKRYEILDGDLAVTPAPGTTHQRIVRDLHLALFGYFHGRGLGEVLFAPLDVILTERDVVEPDILVVSDPGQVSSRGIEGPPLLVVEVLSPSTRERDRTLKAQRYAALGVRHYWIVDPEQRRIECLRGNAGRYEVACAARGDGVLVHPDWDGLRIDLGPLWPPDPGHE